MSVVLQILNAKRKNQFQERISRMDTNMLALTTKPSASAQTTFDSAALFQTSLYVYMLKSETTRGKLALNLVSRSNIGIDT
mmetsp:Transcript_2629/g.6292  ORF Transcript_2629/g.6292 Transcript_2629/m.6292 type:complete len:81 (-) Transcript_2629:538-780(-)